MGYRDDREALQLQVSRLERDNDELRRELSEARAQAAAAIEERHETRLRASRDACVVCGGSLHAVAVFTGHSLQAPMRLHASTIRFAAKQGGFTHAAIVRSLACTSCGFIHSYIDMEPAQPGDPASPPTAPPSDEPQG